MPLLSKPASSQSLTDLGIPNESQFRAVGISPSTESSQRSPDQHSDIRGNTAKSARRFSCGLIKKRILDESRSKDGLIPCETRRTRAAVTTGFASAFAR